jgi:hypothetical protein
MTEKGWLRATDPQGMLGAVIKPSRRKLRLYAVACCRRIWGKMRDKETRRAVEVAERYADGLCSENEVVLAQAKASNAWHDARGGKGKAAAFCGGTVLTFVAHTAASNCGLYAAQVASRTPGREDVGERAEQAVLFRDIFGNPFRPVAFSDDWRTDTAVSLARMMYDARDFSAMPILADALQDAGCDSDDILDHCRGPGPHVRGCWVVDLVLGKE